MLFGCECKVESQHPTHVRRLPNVCRPCDIDLDKIALGHKEHPQPCTIVPDLSNQNVCLSLCSASNCAVGIEQGRKIILYINKYI